MRRYTGRVWNAVRQALAVRGLLQWTGWWETVVAATISVALSAWSFVSGLPLPQTATIALAAFVLVSVGYREWHTRLGLRNADYLPEGSGAWRPVRVDVSIPDASGSRHPQSWAEALGEWRSFAVHNLWANLPTTRGDLQLWTLESNRWADGVEAWMKAAGCPSLDIKEFTELGDVQGGPFHPDPALNRELVMLKMKRDRLTGLITRYCAIPTPTAPRPVISIDVAPGTARMGDGRVFPSADITLNSTGNPFTLVVQARLVAVSPGFEWCNDRWEYDARQVRGGNAKTWFHIATLVQGVTENRPEWLLKVRGEHMQLIRRWQGRGNLAFDVEWTFQIDFEATLHRMATAVTRVTLSDDRQRLLVSKLSESLVPSFSAID